MHIFIFIPYIWSFDWQFLLLDLSYFPYISAKFVVKLILAGVILIKNRFFRFQSLQSLLNFNGPTIPQSLALFTQYLDSYKL